MSMDAAIAPTSTMDGMEMMTTDDMGMMTTDDMDMATSPMAMVEPSPGNISERFMTEQAMDLRQSHFYVSNNICPNRFESTVK